VHDVSYRFNLYRNIELSAFQNFP